MSLSNEKIVVLIKNCLVHLDKYEITRVDRWIEPYVTNISGGLDNLMFYYDTRRFDHASDNIDLISQVLKKIIDNVNILRSLLELGPLYPPEHNDHIHSCLDMVKDINNAILFNNNQTKTNTTKHIYDAADITTLLVESTSEDEEDGNVGFWNTNYSIEDETDKYLQLLEEMEDKIPEPVNITQNPEPKVKANLELESKIFDEFSDEDVNEILYFHKKIQNKQNKCSPSDKV